MCESITKEGNIVTISEKNTSRSSLRQRIYAAIKNDIITCKLAPGEPLSENQFVERFQVSKTPIREAFTSLEQDHLVEYIANRGFMVAPISVNDVKEIFEARLFYETALFKLALKKITPEDIDILEGYSRIKHDPDQPEAIYFYLEANLNFHVGIARIAGNSRLSWHYAKLLDEAQRLIFLDFQNSNIMPAWHTSHHGIVEALRNHDESAGVEAIEHTLELAKRRILSAD
jgi:DNA-binding GntR family transcriptional regulator